MKANIGMMYPVFAPISAYTPGSAITYGDGAVIQEAVSANIAWERSDNHFYGDDVELDNDNGIPEKQLEKIEAIDGIRFLGSFDVIEK